MKRRIRRLGIAFFLALLGGGGLVLGVWSGAITQPSITSRVDRLWARNFGTVAPGLYRGGQPSARGRQWLWDRYHFGTVIHLAWRDTAADHDEEAFYRAAGADYHHFAWQPEGPPAPEQLEAVLRLVRQAPGPVFVHCAGGKDRTGGVIGLLELERGSPLADLAADWRRYGVPSRGWQAVLREAPRSPPSAYERAVQEITAIHGGAGPFVVAGYRMGQAALQRLGLERGSFDLEVTHFSPTAVQYSCIADGAAAATGASLGRLSLRLVDSPLPELRTRYRRKSTGVELVLALQPSFLERFLETPRPLLLDAGQQVLRLPDEAIFQVLTDPPEAPSSRPAPG